MKRIRVLIVDDHAVLRQGLTMLLASQEDMTVVGELAGDEGLEETVAAVDPDVVVMDISMPGNSGQVATRRLKRARPGVAIVVLTRHDNATYLRELLGDGASGYVLKQSATTQLLSAIRAGALGATYIDPAMAAPELAGVSPMPARVSLAHATRISPRESEVLRLVAIGHGNKEIATRLAISVKTVETHRANAGRKLGFNGRVDIVRYGVMKGWLSDT